MSQTDKVHDSDNEFYDACESLSHQQPKNNDDCLHESENDEEQDENASENSDFESEKGDLFKKFEERFNLDAKSDQKDEKFKPLHELLNEKEAEKNKKSEHVHEDKDVIDDDEEELNPAKNDPYFIDEAELEKEQASLSEQEKQERLEQAQVIKQNGNTLFKEEKYSEALDVYTQALKMCPLEFRKERSIFYSNRSVCFLKIRENLKCIKECTRSIELDPTFIKPLLRRAELHQQEDKLDEALKDYQKLYELERKYQYRQKCVELEELIKERNEKLKTEMFSKLKDLGNLVLKPFGLSTENFQFVQDPNTGSYSVNFNQSQK